MQERGTYRLPQMENLCDSVPTNSAFIYNDFILAVLCNYLSDGERSLDSCSLHNRNILKASTKNFSFSGR